VEPERRKLNGDFARQSDVEGLSPLDISPRLSPPKSMDLDFDLFILGKAALVSLEGC
jgi:hypothetical protein